MHEHAERTPKPSAPSRPPLQLKSKAAPKTAAKGGSKDTPGKDGAKKGGKKPGGARVTVQRAADVVKSWILGRKLFEDFVNELVIF